MVMGCAPQACGKPLLLLFLTLRTPVVSGSREGRPRRKPAPTVFTISADGVAVPPAGLFIDVPAVSFVNASTREECKRTKTGHPSDIECPQACPFLRAEPTQMCAFSCVPAGDCRHEDPLSSFANPDTMRCEGCKAVACTQCLTSWTCAKCQDGFELSRHSTCVSKSRARWWLLYVFLIGVVGPVLYYIIMLPFRPIVNKQSLEKALEFREVCKQYDHRHGQPFNLWRNLGTNYIAGIGVMLHFRWQQMVIAWSILVGLLFFVLSLFFNTRPSAVKHDPSSPKAFSSCEHGVIQQANEFILMEKVYFYATIAVYICSTLGSVILAVAQRRTAHRTEEEVVSMEDYAVLATGFPIWRGTRKCEDDIQAFFQDTYPDLEIVGVSVCWNIRNKSSSTWVEEQIHKEVFDLDCEFDASSGDDSRKSPKKTLENMAERPGRKNTRLECFDTVFGIGPSILADEEPGEKTPEEIEAMLGSLETAGAAFIVFETERQCQEALERARKSPPKFDDTHTIYLEHNDCEPETVNWDSFGVSLLAFIRNIILGNICIFVAVIVLDIFFYAPYVMYIFMYADVKGMVGGGVIQGTLLGLLITICNQIIYQLISFAAEKCGFRFLGPQRQFYVVQYTVAVFFNTCVDLWTVMLLAQGFSVQDVANHMQDPANALGEGGVLSPKAIAEQPAVQRSVYVQLLTYLFPGCLLIPFLLEPVVAGFLTYFVPQWLVRSRTEVNVNRAERMLAAPDFDLSRYGDILVNVMLCSLVMSFTYRDLYQCFMFLTASLVIIYLWDHYRFLRCTRRSIFPSPSMEYTSHWLLAVPCAIMASALVFRSWAATDDGFLEPMSNLWNHSLKEIILDDITRNCLRLAKHTILWYMLGAFVAHLIIHFTILHMLVPALSNVHSEHDDMVPYSTTAETSPCTWFNANPVHTLRSKYVFKHRPPCIPYEVGKAYLLKMNPSIGQYYCSTRTPKAMRQLSKQTIFGLRGGV